MSDEAGDAGHRSALEYSPPPVPWSPLEAIAVFVISTGLGLVIAALVHAARDPMGLHGDVVTALLLPLTPLILGLTTLAVVGSRHPGSIRRLLGRRRSRLADWGVALGVALVGYVALNLGLGSLLQWLVTAAGHDVPVVQETFRQAASSRQAVWGLVVGAVVLAPIAEELLYRGMLFQTIRDRLGVGWGIWLSAAVFALTHVSLTATWIANGLLAAVIFPLGALFAWAFHRRGTLLVPIVAHALFNAVNVAALTVAPS